MRPLTNWLTPKPTPDPRAHVPLLDIIRALGKGDPLAAEYQRKLFALMY